MSQIRLFKGNVQLLQKVFRIQNHDFLFFWPIALPVSLSRLTLIWIPFKFSVTDAHVRKVGSIADYDPMNDRYGSLAANYGNPRENQGAYYYGKFELWIKIYEIWGKRNEVIPFLFPIFQVIHHPLLRVIDPAIDVSELCTTIMPKMLMKRRSEKEIW